MGYAHGLRPRVRGVLASAVALQGVQSLIRTAGIDAARAAGAGIVRVHVRPAFGGGGGQEGVWGGRCVEGGGVIV